MQDFSLAAVSRLGSPQLFLDAGGIFCCRSALTDQVGLGARLRISLLQQSFLCQEVDGRELGPLINLADAVPLQGGE